MRPRWRSRPRSCGGLWRYGRWCASLALFALLAGCANGDFGRPRRSFITDDMHAWIGPAALGYGVDPIWRLGLTDDERLLRDLAYPLIAPPYDWNRWYSILEEYGTVRLFYRDWWSFELTAYSVALMSVYTRSPESRYQQLIDDARNDMTRLQQFLPVAGRVLDIDDKRGKSMAFVPTLGDAERALALTRIAENKCIVQWVYRSLIDRAASYRFALEHLVVALPTPMALEAERVLTQLNARIAENRLVEPLRVAATAHPVPVGAGVITK
jgi:hypothetical protein